MWTARITSDQPISGSAPEKHFSSPEATSGSWLWVAFEHDEGARWFGCFQPGHITHVKDVASADNRHFFVIAGGIWYCVDAGTRELRSVSDRSFFFSVLPIPGGSAVALADLTSVTIAEPSAVVWKTPRLAWDGLRLLKATQTELIGVAETGHGPQDDREFRIDLTNRTVSGGHVGQFAAS